MKKNIGKRILSLALALVMVVGMMPILTPEAKAATASYDDYGFSFSLDSQYCRICKRPQVMCDYLKINSLTVADNQLTVSYEYKLHCCHQLQTNSETGYFLCTKNYTDQQVYAGCALEYSRNAGHLVDTWTTSDGKHSGNCVLCGNVEERCSGGTATCIAKAKCSACGKEYGDYGDHSWGDWTTSNGRHIRTCVLDPTHTESGNCDHEPATCLAASACSVCKHEYAAKLDHSYTYTADGFVLTETCTNGCGHSKTATLQLKSDADLTYTGSPITPMEMVYPEGWAGEKKQPADTDYTNNVNAGTNTASCSFTYIGSATVEKTFSIEPASLSECIVTMTPASGTYTGSVHNRPTYTLTYNGKQLVEGTDYIVDANWSGDFTSVGSCNLILKGNGNFTGYKSLTYTIGKGTPTKEMFVVQWPQEPVYDGDRKEVTVTSNKEGMGQITVIYFQGNDLEHTLDPIDAHGYNVAINVAEGKNYNGATIILGSFSISSATGQIEIPAGQTVIYDGEAIIAGTSGADILYYYNGDSTPQVKWYSDMGGTKGGEISAPTNAGTYWIGVSAEEGNYTEVEEVTASITIDKKEVAVPNIGSKVYNGTAQTAEVPASDLYAVTENEGGTAVGSYDVVLTLTDSANCKWTDSEEAAKALTFQITQAQNSWITEPNVTNWTYGGGANIPTADAKFGTVTVEYRLQSGEDVDYTTDVPSNAGKYYVRFSVPGTENYAALSEVKELEISRASLTITAENKTVTYSDAVPNYTVTYSGFVSGDDKDDLGGTLAFECDYAQFANKGEYTITPSGLTSGNYEITYKSGTLTVNPKPITVTIADKTSVYGEAVAELTATADGIVNNDPNVYALATDASSTANVGTYPITGTPVDSNYAITFVDGTYTVTKATNQWTTEPSITGWTYGEIASTPTAAAKCGNVTVTYAEKGKENFTAEVPTQAGDYTAKFTVTGNDNYNGLEETRDFTIAKKALSVTEAVATGREYDGTKTVAITEVKLDGVRAEDTVAVDLTGLTGTLESADKGTYTSVTLPELTLKDDKGNYTLTQPTAAVKTNVEITAKPITVTVADIADQTWTGSALSPAVVSPTGLVKETDEYCTVTYTDNTNVGLATVNVEEKGNYTFTAIEKTFLIVPNESLIAGLTTANVTSADKTDVDKAVAMMNNADLNDAPAEDKADWEALKTLANALQERIEAADTADQTQNIQDAENIGAGNVKLDQKQDLEDALKDLEAAKENYSGNYTQEEKDALEADIKRIEDALAAIERVEDFNAAIDDSLLKEDVKTDMDAATEAAIKDAQAAYGELTDYEKTLIDPADKTKLDTLVATITAYKITKGDGGRYTVGSGKTLSFTANGPVRKFDYVQVNGKTIASSNYTVTEGSTIITLKSSYLDKLGYGKHKIQIFYTDGSTDVANFRIYVSGGNPFTGDNTHMMLFAGIMMTSLLCMVMMVMFVAKKKGKYQR